MRPSAEMPHRKEKETMSQFYHLDLEAVNADVFTVLSSGTIGQNIRQDRRVVNTEPLPGEWKLRVNFKMRPELESFARDFHAPGVKVIKP